MSALDRFLAVLFEKRGKGLFLESDRPVALELSTGRKPVTKDPATSAQILALVREVMPEGMRPQLDDAEARVVFGYVYDGRRLHVDLRRAGARVSVAIVPTRAKAEESAVSTPAESLLMPPSIPAPAAPAPRAAAASAQAEKRIQELLRHLVESDSSDLHLRVGLPPTYRTHGDLVSREGAAPLTREDIETMLASIMPERNRLEYEETNDTDFAYEIVGLARFRANTLRERAGPAGVFRVIPAEILTAEQLGVSPEVQKLCYLTKGLVVVTGPTGSGKSTTLAAMIDIVNRTRADHIITIEDPIEFVHPNKKCIVTQRQVGSHTQSFKRALRAALREDPDVILIGELRDLETVAIAIETAETGHLVFGTLHTTTAVSTVDRIIDQFPADRQAQIRVMLSESLKGVVAQVLLKKIGGGRVAAREVLLAAGSVSNLIREGKTFQLPSIIQTSKKLGMVTLNDSLFELVEKKLVTPEEAYLKAVDKTGLEAGFKARNIRLNLTAES
jgi:twitching motility protein PilT